MSHTFLLSALQSPRRVWLAVLLLVGASLACNLGSTPEVIPTPVPQVTTEQQQPTAEAPNPTPVPVEPTSQGLSTAQRQRLAHATVLIIAAQNQGGQLTPTHIGSGTIISADGLILTNAHVASPASQGDFEFEPDTLIIAMLEDEDKAPVPTYQANLMAVDGFLDLAVIKIATFMDGSPANINFDYVELGNSDDMHLGDTINIFGFPGIGGNTITFTKGSVSGFTEEAPIGPRAWIKTDATIAGGNSGGLGANDLGQIIGVPTIASSGAEGVEVTDCRVIQDTNGDGRLDQGDTCIPIGGFINALRPINLALPLIRAAQTGVAYTSPYQSGGPGPTAPGSGGERFDFVAWSEDFGDDSCPLNPVASFPSGVQQISAIFSHSGMTDGQSVAMFWLLNGEVVVEDQFAWDGGPSDDCFAFYVHNGGEPLPDGTYTLALYTETAQVAEVSTTVGGSGSIAPSGEDLVSVDGYILDADTGKGIPNAVIVILNPGVDPDAWLASGTDADVYAYAQADSTGYFVLPVAFQRGVDYPGIAGLEGYQPSTGGLFFDADDPAQITLTIELTR